MWSPRYKSQCCLEWDKYVTRLIYETWFYWRWDSKGLFTVKVTVQLALVGQLKLIPLLTCHEREFLGSNSCLICNNKKNLFTICAVSRCSKDLAMVNLTSIDVLFLAPLLEIYERIFNRLHGSKSNITRFYIYTSPAVIIISFYDLTRRNGPYKMYDYRYIKSCSELWDTSCTQMWGRTKKNVQYE